MLQLAAAGILDAVPACRYERVQMVEGLEGEFSGRTHSAFGGLDWILLLHLRRRSFGSVVEVFSGLEAGGAFYCMLGRFEREVARSLGSRW